jgi:formylmethanofuran dehydrogenase subunit E
VKVKNMKKICGHAVDEYIKKIEEFHGSLAPGLLVGGFMVDLAMKHRPAGEFLDALCETSVCLPDAVQLLTPCTIGNGWLKIADVGRFALALFEKLGGEGVRVCVDAAKLEKFAEVRDWFMNLKPKREQDKDRLIAQIIDAGTEIMTVSRVRVEGRFLAKEHDFRKALCPGCGEAYPARDGERCRACQGGLLYHE